MILKARTYSPSSLMQKRSKYGNRRCTYDGLTFASKVELRRYQELKLEQQAGAIERLSLQPRFPLIVKGQLIATYVADYDYWRAGKRVIEDVKGGKNTDVFRIKSKLFHALFHPLKISEIRYGSRSSR